MFSFVQYKMPIVPSGELAVLYLMNESLYTAYPCQNAHHDGTRISKKSHGIIS